jgi:hypothetical protein
MSKGKKIFLFVTTTLLSLVILAIVALNGRAITRYDELGKTAPAVVTDSDKEIEYSGKTKSSKNWVNLTMIIDGDSFLVYTQEYIDDDRFRSMKKGDIVDVVYFVESFEVDTASHWGSMVGDDIVVKAALEDAKSNRPSYYIFAGAIFVLGLLPLVLGRRKKE